MATKHKAPGKAHREGISLVEVFRMFPDDATAEAWFVARRWPTGIACPHCGSLNVQTGAKHKTMPYRCREKECAKRFSPKTRTVMEGSKLGLQVWMIATYLLSTSLKSVSSMKLHRDLNINQRSAWFLAHRLRVALAQEGGVFSGPVEVDETYMGGRRKNMSNARRAELADTGRGAVGKAAVVGAKDRATKQVAARMVPDTTKPTLQGFVAEHATPDATVYTDDAAAYQGMPFDHETVKHALSVCPGRRSHERDRIALVDAQACSHGDVSQNEPEALGPVRARVRRATQPARRGHHRHHGGRGHWHERQAPSLP